MFILPNNHAIKSLLERKFTKNSFHYCLSLENIISKQHLKIKSSVINANNHFNGIFSLFDSLNSKFSPGSWLVDNFSSHFFFYQANHKDKESRAAHSHKFDDIVLNNSSNSNSVIVVSNASIKNNITMSIVHIYSYLNSIKKTLHHAVGITFTEAELFAIRHSINQAIQIPEASHIIIITDSIHMAHRIFNLSIHPYQQQSITISKDLRSFFNKHSSNSIEF